MEINQLVFIPVIAPIFSSALIMVSKTLSPPIWKKIIFKLSIMIAFLISGGFTLLVGLYTYHNGEIESVIGGYNKGFGISYTFTFISSLIAGLSIIITFVAYLYDSREAKKVPDYTITLLIQLSSIMMALYTRDLFNLFVALEIMGITSYVLISFSRNRDASYASFSYLLVSSTLMVFFLLGTYGIYRITGSLNYSVIQQRISSSTPSLFLIVSISSIIMAILVRSAIIGLHFWLPSAHASAKHSVSAVLSGLLIKIPIITLLYLIPLFPFSKEIGACISLCGVVTAIVGVIYAFSQSDVKRLLAYHSVSQMGYIMASFGGALQYGINSSIGTILLIGSISHTMYHAIFKSTLFLSIGTTVDILQNRDVYQIRGAAGRLLHTSKAQIVTIVAFFVASCSIVALPPFNGFYSKYLITTYLSSHFSFIFLSITSAFTVASFIKLGRIFFKKERVFNGEEKKVISRNKGVLALLIMVFLLIISSIIAVPLIHILGYTSPIAFYSATSIMKTILTFVVGITLFLSLKIDKVKKITHAIETYEASLGTMMAIIPISVATLSIYLFIRI
ncbi:MAG: hypothetical protein EOM67_07505 [Spirochaetia bacterium]|nr:hypothetical protein [Spirochaetia bacterium]